MKTWLSLASGLVGVCLFSSVYAADSMKIGVVDMNQVMQKSALATSLNDSFVKKFQSRQDQLTRAQKDLQDENTQLSMPNISQADRTKLQEKIVNDKANVDVLSINLQRDVAIARSQNMQTFMAKLNEVINKIARDGNYDLIQTRNDMPYVNSKVDITAQVLRDLS